MLQDPDSWHYGYGLSRAAILPPGTLYPMLARLAEQGLLEASWLQPEHPVARPATATG
jgi:DNA-binding PadR family transcriptional regulator